MTGSYRTLGEWKGALVVAGYDVRISGTTISNVARWNDTTWTAIGSNSPNYVDAVQEFLGDLYLVHSDDLFSGPAGITRWDGVGWQTVGSGLGSGPQQPYGYALCLHAGGLVAGGEFQQAGGFVANNVALWDGIAWHAFGAGLTGGWVGAVASWNGSLVAGGTFTGSGAQPLSGAALWNGTSWQQMGSNIVQAAYFDVEDGELFASGYFRMADGSVVPNVAHWTGSDWHVLGSGSSDWTFEIYDGYLYEAGNGIVNGHLSHNLSRVPLGAVLDVPRPRAIGPHVELSVRNNPARGHARFTFSLPSASRARLAVYDLGGRSLATLADGAFAAGTFEREWSAPGAPGTYFIRLDTPAGRASQRFVFLGP